MINAAQIEKYYSVPFNTGNKNDSKHPSHIYTTREVYAEQQAPPSRLMGNFLKAIRPRKPCKDLNLQFPTSQY
jgi:hypothetical protein